MKKLIALILAVMMALALVACSAPAAAPAPETSNTETEAPVQNSAEPAPETEVFIVYSPSSGAVNSMTVSSEEFFSEIRPVLPMFSM